MSEILQIFASIRRDLNVASQVMVAFLVAVLVAVILLFCGNALYRLWTERRRRQEWLHLPTRATKLLMARRSLGQSVRRITIDTSIGKRSVYARSFGQVAGGNCKLCHKALVLTCQRGDGRSQNLWVRVMQHMLRCQVFGRHDVRASKQSDEEQSATILLGAMNF